MTSSDFFGPGPNDQPSGEPMAGATDPTAAATPMADSVRIALATEAKEIAAIQRRSWSQQLPPEMAETMLAAVELPEMTDVWQNAIHRPPEARFRVLVAVADNRIVGFASTVPSPDPDADGRHDGAIDEFLIDPVAQRKGHGSRLLNACVDTLRADGFQRVTHWVSSTDDITRTFLTEAGWAADGSHREIGPEDESVRIKQVRLHTDVSE